MKPSFLIGRARAITCLLIFGLPIIAQAESSVWTNVRSYEPKTPLMRESITLEDAIKRTLADNPNLHEFEFRQQVLAGETKTAGLKPGLIAGVELENFLGTGEVSGLKELEMTLTLSSVIQLDNKPAARLGVLSARREQQDVEKKIRTLDLLGELNRRYIHVLSLQALLAVTKEAEALARYTLEAVSKRVEAGASPLLEQKRALSALAQSQLDVDVTKQNLRFAIRSLAIMWGEPNPSFRRVEGKLFVFQETASFNALSMAIQNSPHIDLFAQQSRVQSAQLRLVQAGNRPDIEWSAGIRRIQGIDETAFVAGVSVPLFQKQRNLGEYEAQKARLDLIEQQKQSDVRNLLHSV
ncbi:TolC family protein [Alteromonas alba]|uniref:TolC family protein n=2 Tax=Alteromonas alba TaxID=2079529 RepID=A0A2S9V8A2_9ALTE|nr:TolC family protein [Alteromonas alba]